LKTGSSKTEYSEIARGVTIAYLSVH